MHYMMTCLVVMCGLRDHRLRHRCQIGVRWASDRCQIGKPGIELVYSLFSYSSAFLSFSSATLRDFRASYRPPTGHRLAPILTLKIDVWLEECATSFHLSLDALRSLNSCGRTSITDRPLEPATKSGVTAYQQYCAVKPVQSALLVAVNLVLSSLHDPC